MRSTIAILILIVLASAVSIAGCTDDPFYPRAPDYNYTVVITGLENFTTENGTATILLPIPAVDGEPILKEGWHPNNRLNFGEERHGTKSVTATDTAYGPMLAVEVNMTDYYYSYAGATPIAVNPGQNMSGVPEIVPVRLNKSMSFDDVGITASGFVGQLDLPTSPGARLKIISFLDQPILPMINGTGGNYTSYVFLDQDLKPLSNDSRINITGILRVSLNHNKVNVSEEGARKFEIHTFAFGESIPGNVTGLMPVQVRHDCHSGIYY